MTELKWICISFSLTLLLSLAVEGAFNINQKWSGGSHFGYEGGFCFPGLCIGGSGGSRVHYGRDHYGGGSQYRGGIGYRETMYCKPLTCYGGSCDALHLHLDKGLYESLIRNTKTAKQSSTVDFNMPETLKHNVINNNYEFKMAKEAAMAPQSN
ncbi:hypothetical protein AtNW77_Chr1g0069861 [Arabidopsis thaliana]|uniref:Glycine-rich protein n=3 Tax=Arabidopsis TaxID=3701 RepID=A0A178W4I3_ARATH|nr:uncharacterized protein AT1G68875 [Arabidopsis thaliana]KAG7651058.1 hypothetical protein ISN45_At01g059540 [Arabidopsis thaliana x Arabidopsis arenosa]AAO42038.1 unknown protein [Arabidopsis thaliana]AEE34853.1 hypothetical protein AT1G68875 [Arabidopsis thaliana]OAP12974.1 hypothetical protein AXX17_AT1G62980 [Arabidopsis thaliana]CAA0324765.1 unnamed protein product [Arabidopsis thaliana]|eukprot:NP_564949.1 hypothetical protein AT1G68875 [Arabidopsis thaliana]